MQLALAASLSIVFALIGVGLWWADRSDTERKIEAARNREAIDMGLDQTEAALRKDNPSDGEIDASLRQVEHRLSGAAPDGVRARFERLKKDRTMLAALDEMDKQRWALSQHRQIGGLDYAKTHFPRAFSDYGINLTNEPAAILADKVSRSVIAHRLRLALDRWWGLSDEPRLLGLIDALDPDADRTAVRAALARKDRAAVAEQSAALDGGLLPPAFAQAIGAHDLVPPNEAIRILTDALAAHPSDFGLAAELALRSHDKKGGEGITCYRIALAIRPTAAWCHNNLGYVLRNNGDWKGAIAAHREAIRLDPIFGEAQNNLGCALLDKGDLEGASAAFKEAARLIPSFPEAYGNLGLALRKKGDLEGAITAFREAARLNPSYLSVRCYIGEVLLDKSDPEGAIAAFREASRLDPKYHPALKGLGDALRQKGDRSGAIAAYAEAVRLNPNDATAHFDLAAARSENGDRDGAMAAYQEAVRLDPEPLPRRSSTWVAR